jgi:uncharacterized protein
MKLSNSVEVEVVSLPEDDSSPDSHSEGREDGVAIPFERISPDTLRNLIAEFVTREWEELGDADHTLDEKIGQVIRQLQEGKAKVVFDLKSETCNIVRVC